MRKRLTALLLALALPTLSACGAKTAEVPMFPVTETTPQQAAPSAQEAPSETAEPGAESAAPEQEAPSEEAAPTEAPAAGETQPAPAGEAEETEEAEEEAPVGVNAYWAHLREQWLNEPEEGYVWTITIDGVTVIDALGLTKVTYNLDLSCSHVGWEMNGVYAGSLAMDFYADLSGLNELMGEMGGSASTDSADGWFRNDAFIMDLSPYNADKERGFLYTLDTTLDENGEIVEPESDPYTDALVASLLEDMGSGSEPFEEESSPVSYWFDWDYHMTEGDMSQSYSVTGVMGIASASGGQDASGSHISGGGVAHSPLGGTFTERYDETFESPFPYIIRVYETGQAVFELHSPMGGPVVIKFYGSIDKIPVEQTTVVKN